MNIWSVTSLLTNFVQNNPLNNIIVFVFGFSCIDSFITQYCNISVTRMCNIWK